MSKVCQVTGKRPVAGNNVSHAHNKPRRRFLPNLHSHRFWVESENRFIKLRLTAKGMRIIDKKGIDEVLGDDFVTGVKVKNLKTDAISELPVEALFIAIGHKPNTELLEGQLSLDSTGYVKVEPGSTRTSVVRAMTV